MSPPCHRSPERDDHTPSLHSTGRVCVCVCVCVWGGGGGGGESLCGRGVGVS